MSCDVIAELMTDDYVTLGRITQIHTEKHVICHGKVGF